MALAGRSAAPVCLLLLLAHLPSWNTQIRPQREPDPVMNSYDDSSQSIMKQSEETPVKELENILNDLKKEREMQEPSAPSEEMQSSVMENILQELKELPEVQKSSSGSESRTSKLMKSGFPSEEHQGPEEAESSKDEDMMPMEFFPEESNIAEVSNETLWNQPFEETPVPTLRTEVTNEDLNDAKRFEFFEKYEGIQDKRRAKAKDLKDLLKNIILACVAVTSLILAVIVLVHIYASLFVKKKQEPVTINTNVGMGYEPDQTEVTEERGSQQLEDNIADTKNQNTVYTENQNTVYTENQNIVDIENQNTFYTENQNIVDIENQNIVDTENQNIVDIENQNIVDIENQNNNNLSLPPAMFLTACEDVKKPLENQCVETTFSPSFLSRKTDLLPLAETLGETPGYGLPSIDNVGENLKVQSRTFKMNTSCKNQEQHSKAKYHDYRKFQDKDNAPSGKTSNKRSSRHRPKSTKHKRVHTNGSSKHPCSSSSSWVRDSSNFSIAFDNENTNESRFSQYECSACACYQHLKGGSSYDSYSH